MKPKEVIWKENQQENGCILIFYASPAMTHFPTPINSFAGGALKGSEYDCICLILLSKYRLYA